MKKIHGFSPNLEFESVTYLFKNIRRVALFVISILFLAICVLTVFNIINERWSYLPINSVILVIVFIAVVFIYKEYVRIGVFICVYALFGFYLFLGIFVDIPAPPYLVMYLFTIHGMVLIFAGSFLIRSYHGILGGVLLVIMILVFAIRTNEWEMSVAPFASALLFSGLAFFLSQVFSKSLFLALQQKEMLQESEERFRTLFESAEDHHLY